MKKHEIVIDTLIKRKKIPEIGYFLIDEKLCSEYDNTFKELFPSKNTKLKNHKIKFNNKLTRISLLNCLKQRKYEEDYNVTKRFKSENNFGILYIISNPSFPNFIKLGITSNLNNRLKTYQTCDPYRSFKVEHYILIDDVNKIENEIHVKYGISYENGEWIKRDKIEEILIKYFK